MKKLLFILSAFLLCGTAYGQANQIRNKPQNDAPGGGYFLWCIHPTDPGSTADFKCRIDSTFVAMIGTEAKLEALLGFEFVLEGEANVVGLAQLNDLDGPSDEECLTWEQTSSQFEWQTCGAGGGGGVTVGEADGTPNVGGTTTIQFDQADGLTVTDEGGGQVQIDLSGVPLGAMGFDPIVEAELDTKAELETQIADVADFAMADGDTYSGTHDFSAATLTVGTDVIGATELKDVDTPNDEECYTYEATGATGEWQACGGGNITVEEQDATVDASVTNIDFGPGFDVTSSPAGEANVSLDLTEKQVNLGTEVTGTLPLTSTSGTEANLEAALSDVTNVWTNNDVADVEEEAHCAGEHDGTTTNCSGEQVEVDQAYAFSWTARHAFADGASFPYEGATLDAAGTPDTIRWDWATSSNFFVNLGSEDAFLENPSNIDEGWVSLRVCQPAGGNLQVVGYDTAFSGGASIHEGGNECTTLTFESYDGTNIVVHSTRGEKSIPVIIGAKDTDLATTDSTLFEVPREWTITGLHASVKVAPTGAAISIDVQDGGATSILSTPLTIDATEDGSDTAATPFVFATDHTLTQYNRLIVDVTQVGSTEPGEELTVWIYYVE